MTPREILSGIAAACLAIAAVSIPLAIGFTVAADRAADRYDTAAQDRREGLAIAFGIIGGLAFFGMVSAVSVAGP